MNNKTLKAAQIRKAIGVFYGLKHVKSWKKDMGKPTMIIAGDIICGTQRYLLVSARIGERMVKDGFQAVK